MAARRTSFGKLERDRAKRAKAMAKRERREDRSTTTDDTDDTDDEQVDTGVNLPQEEVLARIQALHERFDDGGMSFDEFEEQKQKLLDHLSVD